MRRLAIFLVWMFLLTACQPSTPSPPVDAAIDSEFTLSAGQTATIAGTGPSITLINVTSDERCPSEIECAMSGPVSILLSFQSGGADAVEINLQTFTDYTGLAPLMEFEGIQSRMAYEGYLIRVAGVLPYPKRSMTEIQDSDYRVSLVVSEE